MWVELLYLVSPVLRGVFLRVLRFSSLRKNQHLDLICDPWSDMDRTAAAAEGAFDVPSTWPRWSASFVI